MLKIESLVLFEEEEEEDDSKNIYDD